MIRTSVGVVCLYLFSGCSGPSAGSSTFAVQAPTDSGGWDCGTDGTKLTCKHKKSGEKGGSSWRCKDEPTGTSCSRDDLPAGDCKVSKADHDEAEDQDDEKVADKDDDDKDDNDQEGDKVGEQDDDGKQDDDGEKDHDGEQDEEQGAPEAPKAPSASGSENESEGTQNGPTPPKTGKKGKKAKHHVHCTCGGA